ncbi:hypothetical protein, conserved [Trypanosoma brucei gambiense DAL972]|uniref:Flagellar attachment zone protein 1 conserved domain-containing protein n=1 Tax=Trypanosoma brucei gambiense (strain MHOM/CI/86/DAL972) TaxID=679716 RepID=C9ZX85_TRYB9|nr:hypothetical protein, conserved [Trypanosoma brucei gambiense DAL972]CBH14029.1 hypothetical protein, conserved [Trypanosoma brucei gambiense DAL972]|eukprot:XP_011776300.1 hypothetical protein, conserved [Trypanosoma brucei gambiense DAL972]
MGSTDGECASSLRGHRMPSWILSHLETESKCLNDTPPVEEEKAPPSVPVTVLKKRFPQGLKILKKAPPKEKIVMPVEEECADSCRSSRPSVSVQSAVPGNGHRIARHTIRFRMSDWANLIEEKKDLVAQAVKEDISEGCGLDIGRILQLELKLTDILVVTFIVDHSHDDGGERPFHARLKVCKFPRTSSLYLLR